MKKLIPILLVLLLMVGLMPVGAFADAEEKSEKIFFVKSDYATSENGNFELHLDNRNDVDSSGWHIGWRSSLTIRATSNNLKITRISVVVNDCGGYYAGVTVSKGTKQPDAGVENGETVYITGINDSEFSFTTNDNIGYAKIKDITVYYTGNATGSILSEGSVWIICAVAAAAVIAVGAIVIVKKKRAA